MFFVGVNCTTIVMTKSPPEDVRKSNFFHFELEFWDKYNAKMEVVSTSFIQFVDNIEQEDGSDLKVATE